MRWMKLAVAVGLLGLWGCAKQEDVIKIGEFASLTGSTATFGQSSHKGVMMALEEVNDKGGVLGKKVQVIVEDDAGKTEETTNAVQKLISRERVVAVIGEVASSRSIVGGNVCEAQRIPMVSPASTNPKVTQGKKWVFRICFIDTFQGSAMATFGIERLKAKTAAVLKDRKNEYSVGLAEFFEKAFTAEAGKILVSESYQEGDLDFKPQLTKIKSSNPDIVFVPGYYTEVGLVLKQARLELGMKMPFLGGDGWDDDGLRKSVKGPIEGDGCYYGNHYSVEEDRPEVKSFVARFQAKHQETPDAMAALGYDVMGIVADAIGRAKSTQPEAIRKALEETKGFQGVTGRITLDKEHNAVKPLVVLQLKDGKQQFVQAVQPK
ncbi:MAG: ABC transporter substrate-binding protein [Planctomycetes bacterium]|nr:ABC transporter substrate-binding protein [Planctomycetota bacterium]MBM4083359.1 ABC transporter substrate-binding protein [Planctomycetota bacterium]